MSSASARLAPPAAPGKRPTTSGGAHAACTGPPLRRPLAPHARRPHSPLPRNTVARYNVGGDGTAGRQSWQAKRGGTVPNSAASAPPELAAPARADAADTGLYFSMYNCQDVRAVADAFDRLPVDPYRPSQYRRFNRMTYNPSKGHLKVDPNSSFAQASHYNAFNRGDMRYYEPIEDATWQHPGFKKLLESFVDQVLKNDPQRRAVAEAGKDLDDIYVFFIRTVCAPNSDPQYQKAGFPTPEGIHQDGMDFVSITCVSRDNIRGGISSLYYDKEDPEPFTALELPPGFTLLLNDRIIYHHVSKIEPLNPEEWGTRDIIVLTFNNLDNPSCVPGPTEPHP
ncbi:unnamed protein product [Pedinophyceae sp. YPF-701]|nr:unnamed protein product [Pedinophyceae sp. YPF-701]